MGKKKLNEAGVANELEGSGFFKEEGNKSVPHPTTDTSSVTKERTNETTNERITERSKIRHTFDIYSDQLLSLKEITISKEKISGKRSLIGELVQEALDLFIKKEAIKQ